MAASDGVMSWLEENNIGIETPGGVVPIVSQAILFDLDTKDSKARPGFEMGYSAAKSANSKELEEGSVGAGTGAVVGKARGIDSGAKGGLASVSRNMPDGTTVGALSVVNSFGEVVSAEGDIIAGPRDENGSFISTFSSFDEYGGENEDHRGGYFGTNTTLVCVAVDASLDKSGAKKIAQVAHNGIARAIRPSHTPFDGDSTFVVATGEKKKPGSEMSRLGYYAALCVEKSIRKAVRCARGL